MKLDDAFYACEKKMSRFQMADILLYILEDTCLKNDDELPFSPVVSGRKEQTNCGRNRVKKKQISPWEIGPKLCIAPK